MIVWVSKRTDGWMMNPNVPSFAYEFNVNGVWNNMVLLAEPISPRTAELMGLPTDASVGYLAKVTINVELSCATT